MMARNKHRLLVLMTGGLLTLSMAGGCAQAEEFRAIASGQVQSGLTSIVTGLIDGLFAVIEPDATPE
ncbi:MAG TPA: hypothetical protein PKN33_06775 [Phycisphaerae bacterium]|nr:hypothetical protein [Phycisphaerae bacterium]